MENTLTVGQLIEKLEKYHPDMIVAINCEVTEDQDLPKGVKEYTKENYPYAKGDNVWNIYGLKDEKILFIE